MLAIYTAAPPSPDAPWDLASALRAAVRRMRSFGGDAGPFKFFRVLAR